MGEGAFAEVDAVGADGQRHVDALVHHEERLAVNRRLEALGQVEKLAAGEFLLAQLHHVHTRLGGGGDARDKLAGGGGAPADDEADTGGGEGQLLTDHAGMSS